MSNETIIIILIVASLAYLFWGFRFFPEKRQIAASIPLTKIRDEKWAGLNLTFYGILTANGALFGSIILFMVHD